MKIHRNHRSLAIVAGIKKKRHSSTDTVKRKKREKVPPTLKKQLLLITVLLVCPNMGIIKFNFMTIFKTIFLQMPGAKLKTK